jgi:hypothetical protein
MDSETEEELDDYDICKSTEIIKVDDEYVMKNGLFGLKGDIILKLKTSINREYELKNLYDIGKEMCVIKNTSLFKRLRYFPPILQIKHGKPARDDDDYEINSRISCSVQFCGRTLGSNTEDEEEEEEEEEELFNNVNGSFFYFYLIDMLTVLLLFCIYSLLFVSP